MGALLVHSHTDVVPAEAAEWSVHPFSGELAGGYLWGRGAIDMKNMVAMVLSVIRDWARRGKRPERDLVLAFVADEEAGGVEGSRFLVSRHPDLFTDCSEAIGEVGGFSVTLNDRARLYLIETAEKGISWLRLRARTIRATVRCCTRTTQSRGSLVRCQGSANIVFPSC